MQDNRFSDEYLEEMSIYMVLMFAVVVIVLIIGVFTGDVHLDRTPPPTQIVNNK